MTRHFQAAVARRGINPGPGVELAGLGYYLGRTWQSIRDPLTATALVITLGDRSAAFVALDLMYNDAALTHCIRRLASERTGLAPGSICVNCSHTHNAPTAGLILGAGERDAAYLEMVSHRAAEALIEAFQKRQPARLAVGNSVLPGMTFNRASEHGPTDPRVSVLRVESPGGAPIAAAINFHSHCIAHMEVDLRAISRDWPGEVVDYFEAAMPGLRALYLQGTCGDVNFRREFNGTERRFEPGRAVSSAAMQAWHNCRPVEPSGIDSTLRQVRLPVRPWTREEMMRERQEGEYRLQTGDTKGWLDGIARVCVNQPQRLPLRYGGSVEKAVAAISRFALAWTAEALPKLDASPKPLEAEVQGIRIGDVNFAAHPAELFTSLGLAVREQCPGKDLFLLGYSNGSIGYLPDPAEVVRRGYAAIQSPKFTSQFPFTEDSGKTMVDGLLQALADAQNGERSSQRPRL